MVIRKTELNPLIILRSKKCHNHPIVIKETKNLLLLSVIRSLRLLHLKPMKVNRLMRLSSSTKVAALTKIGNSRMKKRCPSNSLRSQRHPKQLKPSPWPESKPSIKKSPDLKQVKRLL